MNDLADSDSKKTRLESFYRKITSKISSKSELWDCFSDFVAKNVGFREDFTGELLLELRVKACRSSLSVNWYRNPDLCEKMIPRLERLAHSYAQSSNEIRKREGRMFISNCVSKIQQTLQREVELPKF